MPIKNSLYHYTRIDRYFYENLINGTVWFSSPEQINDPYDCQPPLIYGVKSTEAQLEKLYDEFASKKLKDILLGTTKTEFINEWKKDKINWEKRIQAGIQLHINKEFNVFCLTKRPDSIRMWSHYADKHKGVVLEFDKREFLLTEKDVPAEEEEKNSYWNVNYPRKGTFLNFLHGGSSLQKNFLGQVLTKSSEWKYEQEVRIFSGRVGLHSFNKRALTRIIFGMKTPIEEQITILKLKKNLGYPRLGIGFVSPVEDDFKIRIKNYDPDKSKKTKAISIDTIMSS